MTIAIKDKNSAQKVFALLKTFSTHSGLNVNINKSEGMWIGSLKNNVDQPFGIKWPKTPIKALGIYHSYDKIAAKVTEF